MAPRITKKVIEGMSEQELRELALLKNKLGVATPAATKAQIELVERNGGTYIGDPLRPRPSHRLSDDDSFYMD